MKKVLSFLAAFVLLGAFASSAWAYDGSVHAPSGQTIYYDYNSYTQTITITYPNINNGNWYGYTTPTGALVIPSTITHNGVQRSVTSIYIDAFFQCTGLTSVTIPNSVTSIGGYAFFGCTGLTSITIPNSVTSIGSNAFSGCTGLTSIAVANGNSVYDSRNNCNAIIETTTNKLIQGCNNTIIPNTVTSIGYSAFRGCSGLTSITIPNSVTSIGGQAFCQCTSLTSVTIPDGVTSIGDSTFYDCSGLTSVTIPNSVTSIGNFAFFGCSGLTSVTIPNSVTSIGGYAFYGCTSLTSVTIGSGVTSIENSAFYGCTGLTSINVANGNSVYDSRNNCNAIIETTTNKLIQGCNNTIIPNTVTSIGNSAFYGCSGLTSITIPNSVTSIGNSAFYGCSGLTSITIPNSVTSIEGRAFYQCTSLTSVTIGSGVTSIGDNAFYGCSGLTSVTIPNSVTSIGYSAFSGCTGLTSINVANGNSVYDSRNNCNAIIETTTNKLIQGCNNTIIPNTVTSIGNSAFSGCSGLTSVTIPNSVTSIGNYAFSGCTGLDTLIVGSGLTTIGGTKAFQNVNIKVLFYNSPAILNAINKSQLTTLTIGASITSIGQSDFAGCSYLDTVYMMPPTPPSLGGSSVFANNASGRVFILNGCSYNNYYTTSSSNPWYTYRNYLRHPLYNINVSVSASDTTHGTAAVVLGPDSRIVRCDSTVVVQATANYGYHFDHWSTGSTANPDTITLVGDSMVTAYFEPNPYAVVGNTSDSVRGLVEGSDTVDYQDTVTLTAVANYGYHFDHWNDGDTTNPRQVAATSNINITAYFKLNQYALVTATNDTLRGYASYMGVSESDYAHLLLSNFTKMTSSTTAPAGDNYFRYVLTRSITGGSQSYCYYKFESADGSMYWHFTPRCTGDNAMGYQSLSSSYSNLFTNTTIGNTITYSGLQGVKITYTNLGWLIEFPVDVHCTQRQSNAAYSSVYWRVDNVEIDDDNTHFSYLSEVSISANPNYGYHFDHWSTGSTANPDTVTLTGDSIITAYFIGLTVLSNDNTRGSVSHSKIGDHLEKITATANYGYHFDHWSNGSTANPDTITLVGDSMVTAYFEPNPYAVVGSTSTGLSYSFDFEQSSDDYLFESLTDDDNWDHWWTIDNIESDNRALFVTNGNWDYHYSNEYTNNSSSIVYAYTTVYLLEGDLSYSYDWRGYGEGGYDYLRVALLPDTMEANASGWGTTSLPTGAIALDGGHKLNLQSNWTTQQGTISIPNSGYYKLVFRWKNDNIAGTNPPAAVDNITISTPNQSDYGVVVGSDTVDYLDTVTLTAVANEHYNFDHWNDGDTTNPRQVVATENINLTAYFVPGQHQLTLNVDTSTSPHGAVSGGGTYYYLSERVITATASYGYHFDHWSNGSTANPDTITLVSDSTVTAYFEPNLYAVVGNTSDSVRGLVEGSDTVDYQDTVTLTAVANEYYHFDHWSDGDTTNPRHIVATNNRNLTAYFELNQYALVTATNDTLRGFARSISGSITDYAHLSLSDFTQMTSSTTAPAGDNYFRYVLTRSITGGSQSYCYYKFESADGSMYWHFTPRCTGDNAMGYQSLSSSYSNLFTNTTIGNTITYDNLQGVKITYTNLGWLIEFPVDVHCTQRESNAAYSSVYWAVCSVRHNGDTTWFDYLSDVPISATANYGYHFDHWSNGSTTNPDTITLFGDSVITAYFLPNQYTITGTSANTARGTVTGSATVDYLDTVTLIAHPNYGYHLDHWTYTNENNNNTSTQNGGDTLTLVANKDRSATAYFNLNQYQLTVNVDNSTHGSVSGGGTYNYNTSHTITATASYGYHFDHWSNGSTANPANITLTCDSTVTAYFERNSYDLTVNVNDASLGTVTTPDGTSALYGDYLMVVATPNEHYHVASWQGQGIVATSADKDSVSVRMLGNRTITCNFAIDTHTVAVTSNDIARGSVSATGTEFTYGSPCTVSATAYTGYTFQSWSNGVTANPYTFAVMEDVELTAIFVVPGEETYTVSVNVNDPAMGTATVNGNTTATVTGGSEVTLTATPNAGYRFVRWNDDNTEETRTVTVTADMSFTAYFESDGTQGIEDIETPKVAIVINGNTLTVQNTDRETIRIFDCIGRQIATSNLSLFNYHFSTSSGVYFVKVGILPSKKIVVVK